MNSKQPSPPQQPPQKVPIATAERAVTSLLKWKSKKSTSEKPQLLPSDEFIYLVLTLTKIPSKTRVNAYKIPLLNPLYTVHSSEICLFVADENSKSAKARVESETLPVSKVFKLTKLKKDFKAYEQKRKLCDSYDLFLADKKIIPLLPNVIGKWFYKKKKIPVPMDLSKGNLKEQIDKVCSSAMLYLSSGSCSVLKVGRASMETSEIVENIIAAVEGVANVVPKKWANVRSFHLKFAESLALPIYQKVPELGFKIGGGLIESSKKEIVVEEGKSGKGKTKKEDVTVKVTKKKGRIHEVRYMDEVMIGEDEAELGIESDGEEVVDEKEQEQEEIVGKKRKKSDAEKKIKKSDKGLKKSDEGLKKKKDSSGKKLKKKSKVSV